ncbi:MAG: LamG-like jellyroll fold domain-containing protein, partial [Patescibacteria group bacterium]|nr:LamG-like jellyroll fold domain-containing protein [Patescibacteria group bacterium]
MVSSFRSHAGRIVVLLLSGGLLALAAVPVTPADASVMTGVTAYWNFDESSGTTAANSGSAGASLDGTLLGATAFVEGLFGNALFLPGGDADYVNVANRVIADGQAAYTISVWFNPDDVKTTGGRRQVLFESDPKYALSAGLGGSNNVVQHNVETTVGAGKSTTFRPTQGQWHHLA